MPYEPPVLRSRVSIIHRRVPDSSYAHWKGTGGRGTSCSSWKPGSSVELNRGSVRVRLGANALPTGSVLMP